MRDELISAPDPCTQSQKKKRVWPRVWVPETRDEASEITFETVVIAVACDIGSV